MSCNKLKASKSLKQSGLQFCVIGEKIKLNEALINSLDHYHIPILYSSSGLELMKQGGEFTTVFVLEEFAGETFTALYKAGQRILGPTIIIQYAQQNKDLINAVRPIYTASMKNLNICFAGFQGEETTNMVSLVHYMGGSVRKEFLITKTTHLVAAETSVRSEKYKYAVSTGVPIMTKEWIYQAWAQRHNVNFRATDEEFKHYKLPPFIGCNLAFLGYPNDEEQHMTDISFRNGGEVVKASDTSCTHIIVDDGYEIDFSHYSSEVFILKNEWFWACIQMEGRAEEEIYKFEKLSSSLTSSSLVMPVGGSKRQRLESVAHQLAAESQENDFYYLSSQLESKYDNVKLSISGSSLDSFSPDKSLEISIDAIETDKQITNLFLDLRSLTPRQQVCFELFQTESNYVGILSTIIKVFMEPLEKPDQVGPLLAPTEIKTIFGYLPPIYEVHQKICQELAGVIQCKGDDHSIGSLFLNHAAELMKSYPPFINFLGKSKEILAICDETKPRFHAFLKRCQSKPECGRQTLQELLIRPVQRLPSIILLLTDILKHTPKNNSDSSALQKAIEALKNVTMHINEDKRKTEEQMEMFDIVNDVENCPANLLSSHRTLISKIDVQELTDLLQKKSCLVTMFLFTDVLEICKKRSKNVNSLKSSAIPNGTTANKKTQSKSYKHLNLIQLSHIKRVVDIAETEDSKNAFAVVAWSNEELKELLYVFELRGDTCKTSFLRSFCRQIANSICKADAENLLIRLDPQQLDLQGSENSGNVLTRALNMTRNKIGKAWSFKNTPAKQSLSRAVSTIISPWRTFKSSSSNLSGLRLSSVTNLTVPENDSSFSLSPMGVKKTKSNTVGVCAIEHI